jgi:hypothetical protein
MSHANGANGAATQDVSQFAAVANIAAGDNHQVDQTSPERLQKIRELLSAPFDPGEIKWRITATSTIQTKQGTQKRGQLVAYADQRAYTDRLNQVFGEWGWTRSYDVQVAQNFERRAPGDKTKTAVAAKVVVVSKVMIHGFGSHTGVGEEWADDQNAATRAEAQAFKRACACFGLGRYLYDLATAWVDLDQYNRPLNIPNLPEWALPSGATRSRQSRATCRATDQPKQSPARDALLLRIRNLRERVGEGLAGFVLNKHASGAKPEELADGALNMILQKLSDIGIGIDRLRKAAGAIGDAQYSAICRELNLGNGSINNIPDRDTLQHLLGRVEAAAAGMNGKGRIPGKGRIGDARGRLLQAARRLAEKNGKRFADVIAEASDGKLSLDGLRDLTDADVALVLAATSRMAEGGDL